MQAEPFWRFKPHDHQVGSHVSHHKKSTEEHQYRRAVPKQNSGRHGEPRKSPEIGRGAVVAHQHLSRGIVMKHPAH